MNAFLVTKVLNIGLVIHEGTGNVRLVNSSTIVKVVNRLMASPDGDEMGKRVEELWSACRESAAEGGISHMELDSSIAHISR